MNHQCPQCDRAYTCGSNACSSGNLIPCSKRCWKRIKNKYMRIAAEELKSKGTLEVAK
jgi:hypothetical protein